MTASVTLPLAAVNGRSFAAMGLLAILWGLSIPLTKLGLQDLSPTTLTTLRFAIAVPLLMAYAWGRQPMPRRAVPQVAGLGIVGIGVGQVAQAYGVAGTSASVGTIVSATIPVFIVFFAAVRLKQTVTTAQRLGILLAFVGIAVIALRPGSELASTFTGIAFLLLSAMAIAFYYVWSVELTIAYGTASVAAWSTLFGLLALLPWAGWNAWHESIVLTPQSLAVAAYLGVVVTVAGLFLWLNILRAVPARVAAAVQFLQPVVGVSVAALMFGDPLGVWFVLGVGGVLAGLGLMMKTGRRNPGVQPMR